MRRKIFIALFILMTIGSWFNLFVNVTAYSLIANPATWDALKVLIDFLVAVCWTFVTILWIRRRDDTLR